MTQWIDEDPQPVTDEQWNYLRRRGMVATKRTELDAINWPDRSPASCLSKAAMDEPIFILRAQDRTSSKIVRAWVQEARDAGCTNTEKLEEALGWAVAAEKWRTEHGGGKVPD